MENFDSRYKQYTRDAYHHGMTGLAANAASKVIPGAIGSTAGLVGTGASLSSYWNSYKARVLRPDAPGPKASAYDRHAYKFHDDRISSLKYGLGSGVLGGVALASAVTGSPTVASVARLGALGTGVTSMYKSLKGLYHGAKAEQLAGSEKTASCLEEFVAINFR